MPGHILAAALCCAAVVALRRRARSPRRFERTIRAFEHAERPQHCTLFLGSSTFTLWRSLEQDLAELPAINRGFGGSTIPDITHYLERIAPPHQPARIVFYAGSNDIARGDSASQVAENFAIFLKKLYTLLPNIPIYFISLNPGPVRRRFASTFEETNQLICQAQKHNPNFHFIDIRPAMLDSAGQPDRSLFGWDRLHMNSRGQARWIPLLREALK